MSRKSEEQTEFLDQPISADPEFLESEINDENRVPFGAMTQRLAYASREGYHRHWFNDSPGRLIRALQAGFKHVRDEHTGSNVSRPVGVAIGGGALMGYLMEIPEPWWRKDMALLHKRVDEVDDSIRRGNIEGNVGQDGRYIPAQRPIKITDTLAKQRPPQE